MKFKKYFIKNWKNWALALFCIGLNFGLSILIKYSGAPLYLDSIGTILTAAFGGLLPGILVGFVSNLLNCIFDPVSIYYSVVSILIAVTTTIFSVKGIFRKWWCLLICVVLFAFYGGVLGSILTWLLYGDGIGTGTSAPFAYYLFDNLNFSLFWSQLTADFLIDLLDKFVSLLIIGILFYILPNKFLLLFKHGENYLKDEKHNFAFVNNGNHEKFRKNSIRVKFISLTLFAYLLVGVAFGVTTKETYQEKSMDNYGLLASDYASLVSKTVDGDAVDGYLETNDETDAKYLEAKSKLQKIYDASSAITFLYVYKIGKNSSGETKCFVVFDLDNPTLDGSPLGYEEDFQSDFGDYETEMLDTYNYDTIGPVIADDYEGWWLISYYVPIINSSGEKVAYAGVDIDMSSLRKDIITFMTKIIVMLISILMIISAITYKLVDLLVINPVQGLVLESKELSQTGIKKITSSNSVIRTQPIDSNDEMQDLYVAILNAENKIAEDFSKIEQQAALMLRMERNIVLALANMVESRDKNTGDHIKRTSIYVDLISSELLKEKKFPKVLNPTYQKQMVMGAPLHDVGKIKISDTILNKPGKLTPEEFDIMKTHTTEGAKIIDMALEGITTDSYLSVAKEMAAYHHERYDGTGYCAHLKGNDIPLSARVMAVADVFDALVSKRSYKEPFSYEDSIKIIKEESGTHFDPVVVKAFLSVNVQNKVLELLKTKNLDLIEESNKA